MNTTGYPKVRDFLNTDTTLRVQPVRPEAPKPSDVVTELVVSVALTFLAAYLVMLGAGAAHGLWEVVPAPGYWTTWLILQGLGALRQVLVRRPAWKWARR